MKLINKNNFFATVCISYTLISLLIILSEVMSVEGLSATHLNLLIGLFMCFLGVFVLSQHYRFERFPPIVVIILQYGVAVFMVTLLVWGTGFFDELHPNAYKDAIRSFTIPYVIGALVYYMRLRIEVKKQNSELQQLKSLHQKRVSLRRGSSQN